MPHLTIGQQISETIAAQRAKLGIDHLTALAERGIAGIVKCPALDDAYAQIAALADLHNPHSRGIS